MKKLFLALGALSIIAACSSGGENQDSNKDCTLSMNRFKTTVGWTAYKTSAKIGVSGKFDQLNITSKKGQSIEEVLEGLEFVINPKSVNSNNPERDNKIFNYFFSVMNGQKKIQGALSKVSDGKASAMLTLNSVSRATPMTYSFDGTTLTLEGEINLEDWSAEESIKSLNDRCYDLHKGEDGVSVLWPDVAIKVTSTLDKNCK